MGNLSRRIVERPKRDVESRSPKPPQKPAQRQKASAAPIPPAKVETAVSEQPRRPKIPVSIRLDADVVEHFKATGYGWQTRINDALRKAMR